jgi:hypothetical protein
MNTTPTNKFFIVSLPRTGTKSLCKMVETMGMTFKHVPSTALDRIMRLNEAEVFADTPVFTPSVFKELVEDASNKFIYIDRPIDEWIDSFERVGMPGNYMALHTDKIAPNCVNKLDRSALEEIFDNQDYTSDVARTAYNTHRDQVMTIPVDRLLIYKFSDGWAPLADFVGRTVPPEADVPHINQNTMYDAI